jgi:O-antigen/teichoic acid export membrane protein
VSVDAPEPVDILRTPEAGGRVIRGGVLRGGGYLVGVLLAAATSVLLLRHLGVEDVGRYGVVVALLGIVSSVTDAGLTAVGARELAVRRGGAERDELLGALVSLRVALTAAGVLLATAFALGARYDDAVVWGTLVAGLGVVLVNTQATLMLPLSVDLRLGAVTGVEVLKQALTLVGVAALVAGGAGLVSFFGIQPVVGAVVLGITPLLVGGARRMRPSLDRRRAARLLRTSLPLAAALAMNVVYLRLLVVLVSLLTGAVATGLFATSFRVFEILLGLPVVVLSVALPVLAVAGAEDRARLRYALQALTETAAAVALLIALAVGLLAAPAIRLLFGSQYDGAAPILQIQAASLVPVFLTQVWTMALVSVHRTRAVAWANAVALAVVLASGAALTSAWGGKGAAAAGVATECVLAALLLLALHRSERDVAPGLAFAWRPGVALAVGLAAGIALGGHDWLGGLAGVACFAVAALVVGAVPREVVPALLAPIRGGAGGAAP